MPIYTYECESCGHREDQRSSVYWRDLPSTCGRCGGEAPRVFTSTTSLIVPGHFMLEKDWAGSGGEGQTLGGRSQIKKKHTKALREAFDAVKDWG